MAAGLAGFNFEHELVSFRYFRERDKVVRLLPGCRGKGLSVKRKRLNPAGLVQLEQQVLARRIDRWMPEPPG
jgi:hypothetical protein